MLPSDQPQDKRPSNTKDGADIQDLNLQAAVTGEIAEMRSELARLSQRVDQRLDSSAALPPIDGGAGSRQASSTLTKEALARMKPADISRLNWADVKEVLKQ